MSPIVWELALIVVAVGGFAIWQMVTLRRDMRITRERREAQARREAEAEAEATPKSKPK